MPVFPVFNGFSWLHTVGSCAAMGCLNNNYTTMYSSPPKITHQQQVCSNVQF
jgi:hypothetical protein